MCKHGKFSFMGEEELIDDAKMDILRGLNELTDKPSDPEDIYHLSKAYKELVEAEDILDDEDAVGERHKMGGDHEEWGDADHEARRLFEDLERHFMHYQKHKAHYTMHGDAESKHKMLKSLSDEMDCHDKLAAYVKTHCGECAEEKAVVMEFLAKKKAMMGA